MEVGAQPITPALNRASDVLTRLDERLSPAYQVVKLGRMALGDAPVSFASTAVSGAINSLWGGSGERRSHAINHTGMAADGLFRGLFYTGGVLHAAAAKRVPWLVVPRAAPAGFGGLSSALTGVGHYLRLGLLGIGGALGALRAARAVVAANGDMRALYMTRDGRGGALQAVGSALLMVRHPVTYLAGAGVFAAALVNDLL